ncbi:MAG: transposase [Thermoplasmata archaeon]
MKETLEKIMNTERDVFIENNNGTRNGSYTRTLNTKYGFIEGLKVPRDREVILGQWYLSPIEDPLI